MLYLDIKSVKLDQLEKLVRQKGVEQQIIFTSEHPRLIRDWKKLVPKSHTLLWNRGTEEQPDDVEEGARRRQLRALVVVIRQLRAEREVGRGVERETGVEH